MRYASHLQASSSALYTASSNEVIDYVHLQSKDSSNHTVAIVLRKQGSSIEYSLLQGTLLPNGSARFTGPITLEAGDSIYGSADLANLVEGFIP